MSLIAISTVSYSGGMNNLSAVIGLELVQFSIENTFHIKTDAEGILLTHQYIHNDLYRAVLQH